MRNGRLSRLAILCLSAAASEAATFYCEGTSKLVSRRIPSITRTHRTWLAEGRMRFDEGRLLTTIVRLDRGEIWIANRQKKTFLRYEARKIAPAIRDIGEQMARTVAKGVARLSKSELIGGETCRQVRVNLSRTPCKIWVEEDSREAFEAVRALARKAMERLGDVASAGAPVALPFAALRGLPRRVAIGDDTRLQLTWTVEKHHQRPVPDSVFKLPPGFREDSSVPAYTYTLPEHVYFLGEVTASYFAESPGDRARSLLPAAFTLADPELVKGFYESKRGAEQLGILRWARPLTFYLAPELWRFPLSARVVNVLMIIGVSYRHGGLAYYPYLNVIKRPAR